MNLTKRQREAVEARGTNLLVCASAGSGKTEVLARRCAALIADPERPCDVDRLLVVTFTRAAAAELRLRVGRMLRERLVEARHGRARNLQEHLRRQLVLLDTAEIGTIDSWCARLARVNFAAVPGEVDPGFSILGEEEALLLRRRTLDELFERLYAEGTDQETLAWLRLNARPNDLFLRQMIEGLNRYREHLVNADAWFAIRIAECDRDAEAIHADARRLLGAGLAEECAFQLRQLDGLMRTSQAADVQDVLHSYAATLQAWMRDLSTTGRIEAVCAGLSNFTFPRKPRRLAEPAAALHEEVKKRWFEKRLREIWDAEEVRTCLETTPRAAALTGVLLRLEADYQRRLSEAKRAAGAYEFGDVQRMALDLLGTPSVGPRREPTPLARGLQERYEHILVDECQDTSPVQVELLRLATRAAPRTPNCFMVGDVKQSIYGFREAEPRLFSERIDAYQREPAAGRVLYLPDNFRAHERLVAGLNEIFAVLFDRDFGGTEYSEAERLTARREEIANPTLDHAPRIELQALLETSITSESAGEEDGVPPERIERAALRAAELIRALLRAGTTVPERDAAGALRMRPLRWSDIVILMRSIKENGSRAAAVLREAGVPCVAAGRESLLDSLEVRDVRTVLSLLVNRRQDVALAAYLRGPLGGLTAEQLLRIRRAAETGAFYDAVEEYVRYGDDAHLKATLETVLRRLDAWRVAARTEELTVLLRRILRETSMEFFAHALPGGVQRVALLRALEALAHEAAGAGVRTTADFVQYLDALEDREIDPQVSAALGENVVRIMTIHAAKGLEFPIVFLLGMESEFSRRPRRGNIECDEQQGIGLDFLDYPGRTRIQSAAFGQNRRRVAQRELEEELRLFYVAATRAREKLYLIGHVKQNAWNSLRERFAAQGGCVPLISRLNAKHMFEWAVQAISAGRLDEERSQCAPRVKIDTCEIASMTVPEPVQFGQENEPDSESCLKPDSSWIRRGIEALRTRLDQSAAGRPAVLSISAVKQSAAHADAEDVPRALVFEPRAGMPAFAADHAIDGRDVGDAYHRFMQFADLERLDSIEAVHAQIENLVARRRLSESAAALIQPEDVVWFAETAVGRRLASAARHCRRETPFVYACPIGGGADHVILRGVIDCLIETDDGLMLLDYKTDRVRDEQDWRQRLRGYEAQLSWYARAARAAFGRNVTEGQLAFFRERRCVEVELYEEELYLL